MALEIPFFSKKDQDLPSSVAGASDPILDGVGKISTDYADLKDVQVPGMKEKAFDIRLPLIGHRTRQWQERFLMTVLFFSIIFGIVFALAQWQRTYLTVYQTRITTDLQQQFQNINTATTNAIQARPDAIDQLESSYNQFKKGFTYIEQLHRGMAGAVEAGGGRSAYEASPEMLEAGRKVARIWSIPDAATQSILSMRDELTAYSSSMQKMGSHAASIRGLAEQIATAVSKGNASTQDTNSANQLRALALRLNSDRSELLTPEGLNAERALSLGKDISSARAVSESLLAGSNVERISPENNTLRNNLTKLQETLSQYQQALRSLTGNQENVATVKQAQQQILSVSEKMKDALNEMKNLYFEDSQQTGSFTWLMLGSVAIALVSLALFMIVQIQGSMDDAIEAEKRREESEQQRLEAMRLEEEAREVNNRNQAAILRLMNELQEVADGDLTTQATVSEDITGAIADSINYTVEELRELVGRVTSTAEQVTSASSQAQDISTGLINASQQQSREIEDATQLVLRMAQDITNVSKSANESAEVARQSLMVASQGAAAVENTIKGMNEIREQIQETAKRIKRLGESSQEIGEITELISDITEQTNVLALNAAIQAASAGEAGRGFSVVAEEVQRLAERSAEATKQIGALVRTIQTDTHDAVAAMENSTQGVVEGAKLSDAAGAALADISRVSNQLAELIQGISSLTEQHAASANGLAQDIQHILGITEQTQQGTQQTAGSIQQLSVLAEELKNSVARFRVSV